MASTNGSGSNAKKAAFEAAYAALKAGKQPSQAEINKIYNQALNQTSQNTGTSVQNTHYSAVDKSTEWGNYSTVAKKPTASTTQNVHYSVANNWIDQKKNQPGTSTTQQEDSRTTKQKYDDAKKAYDDYIGSDERAQKVKDMNKVSLQDAMSRMFNVTGGPTSDALMGSASAPTAPQDSKERELNSMVEHYRQQLQMEEDQRIMDADLKELESWSEEDRNNLDRYIAERDQHAYNALNPMLGTQFDTYNLNPIVEKYGVGKVRQMAESLQRNQNAETTAKAEEAAKNTANKRPWLGGTLGSLASVGAKLAGAYTGPLGYAVETGQRTGRYSTLDPNNIGNLPSVYGETVISEVAQNIRGDEESTNWLRNLAAFGYQGGMSVLDSAARIAAGGGNAGISSAIAASGAFSNGLRQYSQQGATPTQAAAMALTSAGFEYITEKLPTEKVLSMFKKGNTKNAVREALTQAFLVEPTSEEVNYFAGVAAETILLGDKSSKSQRVGELIANGMSYEEAQAQVWKELWNEVGQIYAVSFFSGLGGAAGATVFGNAVNGNRQTETQTQAAPADSEALVTEQPQNFVEATGEQLAQQMPKPEEPAPLTEGQQHLENGIAETLRNALNGEAVSNRTAEAILKDPASIEELTRLTGVELNGTKAENRRAIKEAINQMFSEDKQGFVDTQETKKYNNTRSEAVQTVIDRLNNGGDNTPTIDEILSIPEIMEAERANDAPETINLPNREQIREAGYQKAMQKGSWNGKDYSGEIQQNRRMDIVIGLPGSGKSSVYTERLSQEHKSRVIDTDDFREYIPEYNGSNASVVHEESSEIRDRVFDTALDNGDNILLSTIGANAEKLAAQIAAYKEDGYQVYLHLNELPNNKSLARAIGRYISEDGTLGRYVSPRLIAGYGDKPTQTYLYLTGQGGKADDKLGGNLRTSRGSTSGDASKAGGAPQGPTGGAVPADLLAGYDWYNNDVERGAAPRLIQTSEQSQNNIGTTKGTGAAEQNFSGKAQYQDLLFEGNVQPDRANDSRAMEIPKVDADGNPVSAVAANVYGSKYTTDDLASETESAIARGDLSYMPISNSLAAEKATQKIEQAGGWQEAYTLWHDEVHDGRTGAEMAARGALLLNHAAEVYEQTKSTGDAAATKEAKQHWMSILMDVREMGTNTAQGLQAMRMIRELAPPDKLDFAVASVKRMVARMGLQNNVQIDENLLNDYRIAETDQQRNEVMSKIQQNVADQIPSTFLDKWTALRYMNMLGNLKTNVRNIAGNVGSAIAYRMKDQSAAIMEKLISVFNKDFQRTKSNFVSQEMLKLGRDDFDAVKGAVSSGGKYGERSVGNDEFQQGVMDKRRIYKSNANNEITRKIGDFLWAPAEGYRRATNWMMNNQYFGDEAFGRAAYARALAGYLKANGIKKDNLSAISPELMDKARKYAIREAQEATFHDNSALANIVSRAQKTTGFVGQAIMPFTKTPANVLTRAVEFSPIGILDTAVKSAQAVAGRTNLTEKNGLIGNFARGGENITGADIVNSLAKTFTGTGLFALGALLWDQGLLSAGPSDDDEEAELNELTGKQPYSLQFVDRDGERHSYTMDWLTPVAMPMFMGAEFWKMIQKTDGEMTFADYEKLFTSVADPMVQMSMLQGLNDSLDSIKHVENNLGQFMINAAVSYLTQGLTNTLVGQLERSTEKNRMTTYVDNNSEVPAWMQRTLGKTSQKIPGWDFQQAEYRDRFGRTQENEGGLLYNTASPGYFGTEANDAATDELYRLNNIQAKKVAPREIAKKVSYTDKQGNEHKDHQLTQEQYQTLATTQGQTAKKVLDQLIASEDYKALTDSQKAAAVNAVYDYASEQGKIAALQDYDSNAAGWIKDATTDPMGAVVKKVVEADLSDAMGEMVSAWKNKHSDAEAKADLENVYAVYKSLSKETQKEIRENAGGRLGYFLTASESGVKADVFTELYKTYWDLDGSKSDASTKANRWAFTLERAQETGKITQAQKNTLKKEMNFVQVIPAEAKKFDELTSSGLSATDAQSVGRTVSYLMPEEGYKQVRDIQVIEQIAKMTLDDISKDAAMRSYMTDNQEEKFDTVVSMGYSPEEYAQIYRIIDGYTSGTGKKARTIAYLQDEYGISYGTAKALYEVFK